MGQDLAREMFLGLCGRPECAVISQNADAHPGMGTSCPSPVNVLQSREARTGRPVRVAGAAVSATAGAGSCPGLHRWAWLFVAALRTRPRTNTTGTVTMSQTAVLVFPPMRVVKLAMTR